MDTTNKLDTLKTSLASLPDDAARIEALLNALFSAATDSETKDVQLTSANDSLTALQTKFYELQTENDSLRKDLTGVKQSYFDLENESTETIKSLSAQLSFATSKEGKANLTVLHDGVNYLTPAGRVYNYGGKDVTIESLITDEAAVAKLIAVNSGVFKAATE